MPRVPPDDDDDDAPQPPRRRIKRQPGQMPDDPSVANLRQQLLGVADVKLPRDAEEPIMSRSVRQAAHEWITEIRAREKLKTVGLTPRPTTLLFGPPGCGKTTLAHHFAARLGHPLVVMRTAAMNAPYIGHTSKNIDTVFATIENYPEPIVLLLDEFDTVASTRIDQPSSGARDQNSVVATLLTLIESFQGILFAATNRAEGLDPAIWRRFKMQIDIGLPDDESRYAIIKRYGAPYVFHEDILEGLNSVLVGASPSLIRDFMEGMKRALILAPELKLDIRNPVKLVNRIIAQVKPHPEVKPHPHLWTAPHSANFLENLAWPPTLAAKVAA